jgi:hypothetical protein
MRRSPGRGAYITLFSEVSNINVLELEILHSFCYNEKNCLITRLACQATPDVPEQRVQAQAATFQPARLYVTARHTAT